MISSRMFVSSLQVLNYVCGGLLKYSTKTTSFLLFSFVGVLSINLPLGCLQDIFQRIFAILLTLFFFPISENSNTDDQGNFQEMFLKLFQNLISPLLVIALLLSYSPLSASEQQQVSGAQIFQLF